MSGLAARRRPTGSSASGAPVDWTGAPPPSRTTLVGGQGVRLEPIGPQHVDDLYAAVAARTTTRSGPTCSGTARATATSWRAIVEHGEADPGQVMFAIVPVETGRAAGFCSLMRIDPAMGSIEVGGIAFGRQLQRSRAATEAMALLMRHVFDDLGYRRYEWKCDSLNAPSRRAAIRLGFIWEGRFRNAVVYKGRNRDTDWFSITDLEWPRRQRRPSTPGSTTATSTTWAASASAWPPARPSRTQPEKEQ